MRGFPCPIQRLTLALLQQLSKGDPGMTTSTWLQRGLNIVLLTIWEEVKRRENPVLRRSLSLQVEGGSFPPLHEGLDFLLLLYERFCQLPAAFISACALSCQAVLCLCCRCQLP